MTETEGIGNRNNLGILRLDSSLGPLNIVCACSKWTVSLLLCVNLPFPPTCRSTSGAPGLRPPLKSHPSTLSPYFSLRSHV